VVLHVCDLSARVNGKAVDVDTPEYTDLNPSADGVTVTLPFPMQPTNVRALPVGTLVSSEWKDGVLRLGFETLQSHAAVIVDADVAAPLPLLPVATASNPTRFHPAGANFAFADDFEDTAPGSPPDKPWLAWNRNGTAITVTKDFAASGRRSLQFTEAPGSSFFPYMHVPVSPFRRGTARRFASGRSRRICQGARIDAP